MPSREAMGWYSPAQKESRSGRATSAAECGLRRSPWFGLSGVHFHDLVIHSDAIVLAFRALEAQPGRVRCRHRTGIDMVEVGSVLLTRSLRPVEALPPGGRPRWLAGRAVPWPGFRPGSVRFSTSRLRPTTPPPGIRLTASGEQPPAAS
jgi:hypothetical protein